VKRDLQDSNLQDTEERVRAERR
ncbi:MAG: hypothetical protein JWN14_460, partial [Chthonomonadales bacterium]|nr:hypothetical protein [Chthonomonadales bacterium]